MSNMDDYLENSYKLGYMKGLYQGKYECVLGVYEFIFENNYLKQQKRIKLLSYVELNVLQDMMIDCIGFKSKTENKDDMEYEKAQKEILEFLR